ncbi:hypothetical protein MCOR27_008064 [Pyricularia oryzae]|uniref:Uncharacterized protein n=1 Tax=Pyricularia grisea TaxID=148305 RepID=A0ABQ8NUX7_PYRGI|nr:hypothetical protein MCOR19_008403 [Pyricularia oryzae]KAI6302523.1 hypothetical protein MCOR33_002110 [Pyricularia grisea]KAI6273037.1 hypothetical protein MCOR27_008064 [Pyricularia oryzae]KAI6284476.1 hypothetical protein MCOR26_001896 [Pyricularia oryzae]KAI6304159.1 hypothetical protein MCOR29_010664 [Pyricularia oryzae]
MRPFSCLAAFAALASTAAAIPTAQSAAPNGLEDAKRNFEKNVSGITRGKMAKLKGAAKKRATGEGRPSQFRHFHLYGGQCGYWYRIGMEI